MKNLFLKYKNSLKEKIGDVWFEIKWYTYYNPHDKFLLVKNYFKNIFKYKHFLANDYDFDFSFLQQFNELKLKNMGEYFLSSDIAEGNERKGKECLLAAKMLKYGMDEIDLLDIDDTNFDINHPDFTNGIKITFKRNVNLKNASRFLNKSSLDFLKEDNHMYEHMKAVVYSNKALNIYLELLKNYSKHWWD